MDAQEGKKARPKQIIAKKRVRDDLPTNAIQGRAREEREGNIVKETAGDLRPPRLVKSIVRKSDVAWFVKVYVEYEKRMHKAL